MGNEIYKKYLIDKNPFLQTGYLNLWNVYYAQNKITKAKVCIFRCDKKLLRKKFKNKNERRSIQKILKKTPELLNNINNQYFLKIIEPLIEEKNDIYFITECFYKTIMNIFEYSTSKLEIKELFLQMINGIIYLNNKKNLLINYINLNQIFLNKEGNIKFFNLSYSDNKNKNKFEFFKFLDLEIKHSNYKIFNMFCDSILINNSYNQNSDAFILGLIYYYLLKKYINDKNRYLYSSKINLNEYYNINDTYEKFLEYIKNKINFSVEDNEIINMLLNKKSNFYILNEIINKDYFTDEKLQALIYINNLKNNNNYKDINIFLDKFLITIPYFENKILEKNILESFLDYLEILNKENIIKNNLNNLIDKIIEIIFNIIDKPMITIKFENKVWNKIKIFFINEKNSNNKREKFIILKLNYILPKIFNEKNIIEFFPLFNKYLDSTKDCDILLQKEIILNIKNFCGKVSEDYFLSEIYIRIIKLVNININSKNNEKLILLLNSVIDFINILNKNIIEDNLLISLEKIKINMNTPMLINKNLIEIYLNVYNKISNEKIENILIPKLLKIFFIGKIPNIYYEKINNFIVNFLNKIKEKKIKNNNIIEDNEGNYFEKKDSLIDNNVNELSMKRKEIDENNIFDDFFLKKCNTNVESKKIDDNKNINELTDRNNENKNINEEKIINNNNNINKIINHNKTEENISKKIIIQNNNNIIINKNIIQSTERTMENKNTINLTNISNEENNNNNNKSIEIQKTMTNIEEDKKSINEIRNSNDNNSNNFDYEFNEDSFSSNNDNNSNDNNIEDKNNIKENSLFDEN